MVGEQLTYSGSSWSSTGARVAVSLDRRVLGHENPAQFERHLPLPDWTTQDCTGRLTAKQGGKLLTIHLRGKERATVLFAEHAHLGKRALERSTLVCAGEQASRLSGTAVLRTAAPNLGFQPIDAPQTESFDPSRFLFAGQLINTPRSRVSGGVFARTIRLGSRRIPAATVNPASILDVEHEVTTKILSEHGAVALAGFNRSSASIEMGSLKCDGCVLEVAGGVHIHGPVSGVGAIVASGDITIDGPVSLSPDNAVALLTPGTPSLRE